MRSRFLLRRLQASSPKLITSMITRVKLMRNTTSIFAIGLYLTIASGRAHSDDRSQFEVASVKLSTQCVFDTSLNRGVWHSKASH